jgi:hypothetical protein
MVLLGMPTIDRFNKDPETRIFLISTLAGGTGLNLTGANKVVIFGDYLRASSDDHTVLTLMYRTDPNWSAFR